MTINQRVARISLDGKAFRVAALRNHSVSESATHAPELRYTHSTAERERLYPKIGALGGVILRSPILVALSLVSFSRLSAGCSMSREVGIDFLRESSSYFG